MSEIAKTLEAEVAQKIVNLKSRYVVTERYNGWREIFSRQLATRQAAMQSGNFMEARGLALVGASGSGKSAMMDFLFRDCAELIGLGNDEEIMPIVSLRIPSPATLKFVGRELLWALDYPLQAERAAYYIWNCVRLHAKARKVIFIHFDEAQDLFTQGSNRELQYLVNTLKSLMQSKDWPIGVILVGTENLVKLLEYDVQLGRRVEPYRLYPLNSADEDEILGFVHGYANRTKLSADSSIMNSEFAARLMHSSNYAFGVSIELIIDAIQQSLLRQRTSLSAKDFASAYAIRKDCLPAFNPFLVREFKDIDVLKLDPEAV